MPKCRLLLSITCFILVACSAETSLLAPNTPFTATEVASFNEPWAMSFLPDGRLLVTEKDGALKLLDPDSGAIGDISGVPDVRSAGQGGFGDIVLHPDFAMNNLL